MFLGILGWTCGIVDGMDVGRVQGFLWTGWSGDVIDRRSVPVVGNEEAMDVGFTRQLSIFAGLKHIDSIEQVNNAKLFKGRFLSIGEPEF